MKELHLKVFNREVNYIPLLVNVKPKVDVPCFTEYEKMQDPKKALEQRIAIFRETKKVKSDIVPFIESNFIDVLIPSIFGSEIFNVPGGSSSGKLLYNDIYETEKIYINDIFRGEMENAVIHLEYLSKNAPDYFYVNPPRPMSPLDYAVVMRGGEFYLDLITEPELSINFMEKINEVTIKTAKYLKKIINQPMDECVTIRGLFFPGIRMTGDAVVNLSPEMIESIMCPFYKKFKKEFGNVMLHFCCTPAPSTHVAPALAKGGGICAVDNWQGYKTMFDEEDYNQETLAVCTDVNKNEILSGKVFGDLFLMNRKRPLFVSTNVESAEEGKKVYDIWQDHFVKKI